MPRSNWLSDNHGDDVSDLIQSSVIPGMRIQAKPFKSDFGEGPGTELILIMRKLGAPECQRCKDYAAWMNSIGAEGCRDRLNEIVGHLADEQNKLSWLKQMMMGGLAIKEGLPLTKEGLVEEAIARAAAKETEQAKKKFPNGQVAADDFVVSLKGSGYCRGLGDAITFAWIAAGADRRISFAATAGKKVLLEMLGQRVTEDDLGVNASKCYHFESNHQALTRVQAWCQALGINSTPTRPPFSYTHKPTKNLVALAPECEWEHRTWRRNNWNELAKRLNDQGFVVQWILKEYGWHFSEMADKLSTCEFLIGNDSMPVHMAGTIGMPAIALFGNVTNRRVLAHYNDIYDIRKEPINAITVEDVLGVVSDLRRLHV